MWRRLVQAWFVWISVMALIPAALACAQTMADRDCCPPGGSMPCEGEQAPGNVESAACCATSSLAQSAIQVVSEQHVDLPDADSFPADVPGSATLPSSGPRRYLERSTDPPELIPDRSCTYLQTARLRL